MRQIDSEPDDRVLAREQREDVAETFRRMGNYEYRKLNFSLAKDYYSKGIQYIKDSPVLYVNRALCFIKWVSYINRLEFSINLYFKVTRI